METNEWESEDKQEVGEGRGRKDLTKSRQKVSNLNGFACRIVLTRRPRLNVGQEQAGLSVSVFEKVIPRRGWRLKRQRCVS